MDDEYPTLTPAEIEAIAYRINKPVVLVGMMGVGKSALGRRLAVMLDCPFYDADDEIVRAARMSISDIFAQYGEAYFRAGERRVITRMIDEDRSPKVIATGGGAFINDATRKLILEQGIAVWLDSDVETLLERTGRKDTRPLLRDGDPREILTRLREERKPYYEQSPIHVQSGNVPYNRTLCAILRGIDRWL